MEITTLSILRTGLNYQEFHIGGYTTTTTPLFAIVIAIVFLFIYFLPTAIAAHRRHLNVSSITIVNIFLGWTFVGWVIALTWSFSNSTKG